MEALWTPLFGFAVFALAFGIGDIVANKTKAMISSVIVGCTVFLVGYLTGIIPTTAVDSTGLTSMMGACGIALMIVNLGTMMNLEELIREWKTVVIALVGLVGLAAFAFTVGALLFGREWALIGSAPISGGLIATIMASDAANAVGRGELAAYATLLCAFQMFAGMPIASAMLKKEGKRLLASGAQAASTTADSGKKINIKLIKAWPASMQSGNFTIAKLAVVAVISVWLSNLTIHNGSQIINQNVMYLIMGVLFTELGFLDKTSLQKSNAFGFLSLALMSILPGNFKSIDVPSLLKMIWPIVGMLVFSAVFIVLASAIAGKVLHISFPMSAAIGVCCLLGYPCTQIVVEETLTALNLDAEQTEMVRSQLLPKMLVSGFTTVTIASVVFAGIIVPLVF